MEKEILAPGILVYRNAIDENALSRLIDKYGDQMRPGTSGYSENGQLKEEVYTVIRDVQLCVIDDEQIKRDLDNCVYDYTITSIDGYTLTNIDFKSIKSEALQFLKYEKDGHFVYHIDAPSAVTYHVDSSVIYNRVLSAIIYFNDDYNGGELFFPLFNIKHKPKAKDIVIFPSGIPYGHQVLPVEGLRYALVTWYNWG